MCCFWLGCGTDSTYYWYYWPEEPESETWLSLRLLRPRVHLDYSSDLNNVSSPGDNKPTKELVLTKNSWKLVILSYFPSLCALNIQIIKINNLNCITSPLSSNKMNTFES